MKLQVIFFKKKLIYYALAIIAFTIITTIFLFFRKGSITTFNVVNENKMMQSDLTGDGNKDILYIKTEMAKYYIQINSGNNSYYLEPSKKIDTVGNNYTEWPMRISLMDISRNDIPEIFTQASENNKAVQHAFLWNGKKFNDIFCNTNNLLGFVDSKNNKTPKVISGTLNDGKINFRSYIFIENKMQSFDYNYSDNYMGKNTVLGFVNLMSSFPVSELNISKDIFASDLDGNDISLLSDLCSQKIHLTFQDAVFKDTAWDKNGNTKSILWTLNFKGTNTTDLKGSKNYVIELILKPIPNNDKTSTFKITSINID